METLKERLADVLAEGQREEQRRRALFTMITSALREAGVEVEGCSDAEVRFARPRQGHLCVRLSLSGPAAVVFQCISGNTWATLAIARIVGRDVLTDRGAAEVVRLVNEGKVCHPLDADALVRLVQHAMGGEEA